MNSEQAESIESLDQIGALLSQARSAKGLNLEQAALQTRLPKNTLVQLEASAFSLLPAHTFARGYLRSYASYLGLDPATLIHALDRLTPNSSNNKIRSLSDPKKLYVQLIKKRVQHTALFLILIFGLFWIISLSYTELLPKSAVTMLAPSTPTDLQSASKKLPPSESVALKPQEKNLNISYSMPAVKTDKPTLFLFEYAAQQIPTVDTPESNTLQNSSQTAVQEIRTEEKTTDTQNAQEKNLASASGEYLLLIRYNDNCWTEITAKDGTVLVSALKKAGDIIEISAKPPIKIRLGFAPGAKVFFNRKSIDLKPFLTGETAHLTLNP